MPFFAREDIKLLVSNANATNDKIKASESNIVQLTKQTEAASTQAEKAGSAARETFSRRPRLSGQK